MAENGEVDEDTANVYLQIFEIRLERVRAVLDDTDGGGDAPKSGALTKALVRAQRDKLAELYRRGKISDDIRRSISRTPDLQERSRRYGLTG